jgi:ATP-dependent RNA helicase DeaD
MTKKIAKATEQPAVEADAGAESGTEMTAKPSVTLQGDTGSPADEADEATSDDPSTHDTADTAETVDAAPAVAADVITEPTPSINGFATLGVDARIVVGLTALGYEEPTPVQHAAIPPLLAGRDVLAQAATGTGKTAAFALPLLTRIGLGHKSVGGPSVLILAPTRELAMQVAEAVHRYGKALGLQALAVYGGSSMEQQVRALKRGVDVVIATPGRALDHIRRGTLKLDTLQAMVLDEADEMLDMGFADELDAIFEAAPVSKQTALFSATLPPRIAGIAKRRLNNPVMVKVEREVVAEGDVARVRQVAYVVSRSHKMAALARVIDIEQPTSAIVFCRTRIEVDELSETLAGRGLRAEALHGGLSQDQRDRVMQKFRGRKVDLLIATDVAARGLDVKHVSHVVNFDVPSDAETYVHRIGRTGRAGREGVAITFAEPRENRLLRNIERLTRQTIMMAQVPTVADLRAHRQELVKATLREAVLAGGLDSWRGLVESLADELDIMDVAAAAVKMVAAREGGDEQEIPSFSPRPEWQGRPERPGDRSFDRGNDRGFDRPQRAGPSGGRFERAERFERQDRPAPQFHQPPQGPNGPHGPHGPQGQEGRADRANFSDRPPRQDAPRPEGPRRTDAHFDPRFESRPEQGQGGAGGPPRGGDGGSPRGGEGGWGVARLWVSAGRRMNIRPGDLVGAIANEADMDSSQIGAIQIADQFSTVEVPEHMAEAVINALKNTKLRGLKLQVRRDRGR